MIHTFWLNLISITAFQFSMFGFHYPKVDIKKTFTNVILTGFLDVYGSCEGSFPP